MVDNQEIIGKISKGSKMDQIYIPRVRSGFDTGSYVVIKLLQQPETKAKDNAPMKPYFYNIREIEPIKVDIVKRIFREIENRCPKCENIIITGSFLEKGFNFSDIDILIVTSEKFEKEPIEKVAESSIGIKLHIFAIDGKSLIHGLETDPLYRMMLSKCIAKKRFLYNYKNRPDYKILDLHLLKSKTLMNNFDILSGKEKYRLTRNLIAIMLYLDRQKITLDLVNHKIEAVFQIKSIDEIRDNMLEKKKFTSKYKTLYDQTFSKIMNGIKNDTK